MEKWSGGESVFAISVFDAGTAFQFRRSLAPKFHQFRTRHAARLFVNTASAFAFHFHAIKCLRLRFHIGLPRAANISQVQENRAADSPRCRAGFSENERCGESSNSQSLHSDSRSPTRHAKRPFPSSALKFLRPSNLVVGANRPPSPPRLLPSEPSRQTAASHARAQRSIPRALLPMSPK